MTGFDPITALGGTVSVNPDGSFQYIPPLGVTGVDDSFNYTIEDQHGAPDTAAVTIQLQERVWYVDNSSAPGGDGRSVSPFDTLLAAQNASTPGDTLYLFAGSGTDAGQDQGILLQDDQHLIGQRVPLLVNGLLLQPAAGTPVISNAGGIVVTLASNNVVSGLILGSATLGIEGLSAGTAEISDLDAQDGINLDVPSVTIARVRLLNVDGFGLRVGNASLTVDTLEVVNANGTGVEVHDCNPTVISGATVDTTDGRAVDLQQNAGAGVSFDSVSANNSSVGGVYLVGNSGVVSLSTIDLTVIDETAFYVEGDTATTRVLGGTINVVGHHGFEGSSADLDITLESLSVLDTGSWRGISLDDCSGSFTITGQGNIIGSGGTIDGTMYGIQVYGGGTVAVVLNGLDVRNTRFTGLSSATRGSLTITNSSFLDTNATGHSTIHITDSFPQQILIEDVTIDSTNTVAGIALTNIYRGDVTIRRTTFRNGRENAILFEKATQNLGFDLLIDDCDIELNNNDGFGLVTDWHPVPSSVSSDIIVQNSRFTNNAGTGGGGVSVVTGDGAVGQVLIEGNTFTNTAGPTGSAITVGASDTGYYLATVRNNTINEANGGGIDLYHNVDSDSRVLVEDNSVSSVSGIQVRTSGTGAGRLDATLNNNTIAVTGDDIHLRSEDNATLCANPHDNEGDQIIAEASDASTFMLHGYSGGPLNLPAVEAWLLTRNPLVSSANAAADFTSGFFGGTCIVP